MEEVEHILSIFDETIMKDFQENLVMLDRRTVPDGYGGFTVEWVEGAAFTAVMTQPQSGSAEIADAITERKTYKVVTGTNITLNKDDYFRRIRDGKIFKILNGNTDRLAPDDSELQMRVTTAEEVTLPND